MRRNGSDAASKLRFFRCPFFGVVVGGLPGRVFKNSFYIFSRPRHALKPPLICLLLRWRACARRPFEEKFPIFPRFVESWGGSQQNFPQHFLYFFNPKVCSKTSANFFGHPTTRLHAVPIKKKLKKRKKVNYAQYFLPGLYIYIYIYIYIAKNKISLIHIYIYIYIYKPPGISNS